MSRVCIMSLFRNDENRQLEARVQHLTAKAEHTDHEVSFLWCVGDSTDATYQGLLPHTLTLAPQQVRIVQAESGVGPGEDMPTRRRRFSSNANALFAVIPEDADYVLLHESDIQSPDNIVDRLFNNFLPCAAWPVLELNGQDQFYDTWAFRQVDGERFPSWAKAPHAGDVPFEVGSFGTVWMAPAPLVRDRVISELCVVDLCRQWSAEGHQLWCDPRIVVRQPAALWVRS